MSLKLWAKSFQPSEGKIRVHEERPRWGAFVCVCATAGGGGNPRNKKFFLLQNANGREGFIHSHPSSPVLMESVSFLIAQVESDYSPLWITPTLKLIFRYQLSAFLQPPITHLLNDASRPDSQRETTNHSVHIYGLVVLVVSTLLTASAKSNQSSLKYIIV